MSSATGAQPSRADTSPAWCSLTRKELEHRVRGFYRAKARHRARLNALVEDERREEEAQAQFRQLMDVQFVQLMQQVHREACARVKAKIAIMQHRRRMVG